MTDSRTKFATLVPISTTFRLFGRPSHPSPPPIRLRRNALGATLLRLLHWQILSLKKEVRGFDSPDDHHLRWPRPFLFLVSQTFSFLLSLCYKSTTLLAQVGLQRIFKHLYRSTVRCRLVLLGYKGEREPRLHSGSFQARRPARPWKVPGLGPVLLHVVTHSLMTLCMAYHP